jgi:hypothetical protein
MFIEQMDKVSEAVGLGKLSDVLGREEDHDCHASPEDGCAGCEKLGNVMDGE